MRAHRSFPHRPSSITQARRYVAANLDSLPQSIADSVLLIVSELATNAIRHAGTGFRVEIDLELDELCISVADSGDGDPVIVSPPPTQPSGRGLQIVELLSDRWGIIPATPKQGKKVWFAVKVKEQHRPLQDAT